MVRKYGEPKVVRLGWAVEPVGSAGVWWGMGIPEMSA